MGYKGGQKILVPATYNRAIGGGERTYEPGQILGNDDVAPDLPLTFPVGRTPGGSGWIVGATVAIPITALSTLHLRLFTSADGQAAYDGSQFAMDFGSQFDKYIGSIAFPALASPAGATQLSYAENFNVRIPFVCDSGTPNVYGVLEVDADCPPFGIEEGLQIAVKLFVEMD